MILNQPTTTKYLKLIRSYQSHILNLNCVNLEYLTCTVIMYLLKSFIVHKTHTTNIKNKARSTRKPEMEWLPIVWAVRGAQAVVEQKTAASVKVLPSTLTPFFTNDKKRWRHSSSEVLTSRNVSMNLRKPSKSTS